MQSPVTQVRLTLTPTQFVAIYKVLYHVRLGDKSEYSEALSDLMVELGEHDADALFERIIHENGFSLPELIITASDNEGIVLELE